MSTDTQTNFTYRLPRTTSHFPVKLVTGQLTIDGVCINLSETGLLAYFELPIADDGLQVVRLVTPLWTVDIEASLTYTDGCLAGLCFQFRGQQQRQCVQAVLHNQGRTRAAVCSTSW